MFCVRRMVSLWYSVVSCRVVADSIMEVEESNDNPERIFVVEDRRREERLVSKY